MRLHRVTINKNLIIDALIASVIVQQSPKLLNEYLFKSSPLTGTTMEIAGAAAAYLLGMLLNKPTVANIGIALAGADLLNNIISPFVTGSGSAMLPAQDYSYTPLLKDYTNNSNVTPFNSYSENYN